MRSLALGLVVAAATGGLACRETAQGAREDAREAAREAEKGAREAAESARQAAREAQLAARDAGKDVQGAMREARSAMREAGRDMREAGREMGSDAREAAGELRDAKQLLDVRAALAVSNEIGSAADVTVRTDAAGQVLYLEGSVRTAAEKAAAERIARQAADGLRVANRLRVAPGR